MGQSAHVELAHRLFLYKTCGECMAVDFVDDEWVTCGHPEHEADKQVLHDGWHQDTLPETCPLRKRRALLGIKEGV